MLVGTGGEGSQHGQIIERPLLLGLDLGQHGDGDYYNDAVDDMTSISVMVFMRLHGQIIARPYGLGLGQYELQYNLALLHYMIID